MAKKFVLHFSHPNELKRGFSAVTNLLIKKRNRLQIVEHGDLRILLTKMEPNINKLLMSPQAQISH